MIEGLTLLPAIEEAKRRGNWSLPACSDCMQSNPQQIRQAMGCAYEPLPRESLLRYRDVPRPASCDLEPSVCPSFTTSLPEVIEAARARLHWSKGAIMAFCHGQPRDGLIAAIEVFESAINKTQQWAIENPQKKAGA